MNDLADRVNAILSIISNAYPDIMKYSTDIIGNNGQKMMIIEIPETLIEEVLSYIYMNKLDEAFGVEINVDNSHIIFIPKK